MHITRINIKNFRKLKNCTIDFTKDSTIFVGANNSGKTSAYEAISIFLQNKKLSIKDFTLSNWTVFEEKIDKPWREATKDVNMEASIPFNMAQELFPSLDVWFDVPEAEIHLVTKILPTLEWDKKQKIGLRLIYKIEDVNKLYQAFKEKYLDSEQYNNTDKEHKIFPKSLHDYLDINVANYFSIKTYTLDPTTYDKVDLILDDESFLLESFPLKDLIKIDTIHANRNVADSSSEGDTHSLSKKLKDYNKTILEPKENKVKTEEELKALESIYNANKSFDETLNSRFEEPINTIRESINYPNFANPDIKLVSNLKLENTLDKGVNILFDNFGNNEYNRLLLLPENYNGLGYQNMISLKIQLLQFADERRQMEIIPALHLVLIEEPEAHLHVQMQETFIEQAYKLLTKEQHFSTQLLITTHSSHIANTVDFTQLRYFKRENNNDTIPISNVLNLSTGFGDDDIADRFAKKYLKLTHSDLLFADGAILVEGMAEKILLPHFIKQPTDLNKQYITLLEINGSHAHVFRALLEKLGIWVLIITDIDCYDKENGSIKERSTNSTLNSFFDKSTIKGLQAKEGKDKVFGNIRIAYQTMVDNIQPNTFEDALVLSNIDFFKELPEGSRDLAKKMQEAVKYGSEIMHTNILNNLKDGGKVDLALDLLFLDNKKLDELKAPKYISEGLDWLKEKLRGSI